MALAIFRKYNMHSLHIAIWQYIVDILSLEKREKRKGAGWRRYGFVVLSLATSLFD
jgi:hypothetical protein